MINKIPSFNGKFYVVGTKNPNIKDPEMVLQTAIKQSCDAGNEIIEHCERNGIPVFFDDYTIESAVLPQYRHFITNKPLTLDEIPEEIVAHSILTDQDAKEFIDKTSGAYAISDLKISKENKLAAGDILESIKKGTFDFINGVINSEKPKNTQKKGFFERLKESRN
ncbi:MAG: hypothetical protein PHV68_05890 [Candidatus Gastranaerophilales bacterium]|nr:hypothetical protein [Candidatus Gastranaerophilales bacterium]